jgi:hypothetical protein
VVKLSDEERERLDALTHMGKHPARLLTSASSVSRSAMLNRTMYF